MSKLAQEIETLRKEAAERAVTCLYNAIENASMYDVKVFDLMQMFFANESWHARNLAPFLAGPVPVADQKKHLQRLRDVIQGNAEERLIEAAGTLMEFEFRRNAIMDLLDTTFGPLFWEDDEDDEPGGLHPAVVNARAEYAAGTLAPEARAIIESIFGEGFFTGAHVDDADSPLSVEVDDGDEDDGDEDDSDVWDDEEEDLETAAILDHPYIVAHDAPGKEHCPGAAGLWAFRQGDVQVSQGELKRLFADAYEEEATPADLRELIGQCLIKNFGSLAPPAGSELQKWVRLAELIARSNGGVPLVRKQPRPPAAPQGAEGKSVSILYRPEVLCDPDPPTYEPVRIADWPH
jgi:hypothetical protein